eukprot:scaffold666797_cov65-Prasinocladus_malaysianus.AAC.1
MPRYCQEQYVREKYYNATYMDCSHFCSPGAYAVYTWKFVQLAREQPCRTQSSNSTDTQRTTLSNSVKDQRNGPAGPQTFEESHSPKAKQFHRPFMRSLIKMRISRRTATLDNL